MIGKTGSVRNLIREPAAMSSKTTIYVAIELSASSWLVAARLPGIKKARIDRLDSGDTTGLLKIIAELRSQVSTKLGMAAVLGSTDKVDSCGS